MDRKAHKPYVHWTTREEELIAWRAQEILNDPEARSNRSASGRRAKSLTAAYCIAQNALPAERRKTSSNFYAIDLGAQHRTIMLRLDRMAQTEQAERARAANLEEAAKLERDRARAEADQARAAAEPLHVLRLFIIEAIAHGVALGMTRAAEALGAAQPQPARSGNGNGTHAQGGAAGVTGASVAAAFSSMLSARTHRTPVDVVGLKGAQQTIVEGSPQAQAFDIRFIPSDSHLRNRDLRDDVVICTKFVPHQVQSRYRAGKSRLHFANGGPHSVIAQLELLAKPVAS